MIEHTTRAFDSDLHELARKIAEMGRLDGEQIADAIDAFFPTDIATTGGLFRRFAPTFQS